MKKSDNQGFKETTVTQVDRRGGVTEMGGEVQIWGLALRGSSRTDDLTFTNGGQKSGGIPWEQVIPAPHQMAQPRVLALGR